jgi:FkbM family methyltransferase
MFRSFIQSVLARYNRKIVSWPLPKGAAIESHVGEILKKFPVNALFDVGAHRGESGRLFRSQGFTKRIVSFEPIPENLDALRKSASQDHDWRVIPYALGDEDGSFEIHQSTSTVLCSLHHATEHGKEHFGDGIQTVKNLKIEVRRLDDLAAGCLEGIAAPAIYLKTDTQGHDLAVLRGGGKTLENVRVLQMETAVRPIYEGAATFQKSFDVAVSLGFRLTGFFIGSRSKDMAVNEMDVVFVR